MFCYSSQTTYKPTGKSKENLLLKKLIADIIQFQMIRFAINFCQRIFFLKESADFKYWCTLTYTFYLFLYVMKSKGLAIWI